MIEKQPLLPTFIRPMLAQRGQPFDSRDYLFEVKWDGIRTRDIQLGKQQCTGCKSNR